MPERKSSPIATEKDHLAAFMGDKESTANLIPSNSAGMVVLKLSKQYLGEPADAEKLKKLQQECIDALSLIYEKEPAKRIEIDFIKKKIKEEKNQFDRVTLYLPKAKTADGSLRREKEDFVQYVFPLDEVVPLVWKALNDESQFISEDAGDEKKEVKQTEQNKKDRIELFFTCLHRMRTEGVCHHGNRNDLVFILNGICKDINLIEDGRSIVSLMLKEGLLKKYQESKPTPELHAALLNWIENSDSNAIAKLVDPEGSIVQSINSLFVKHGIDPQDKIIKKLIDEGLSYLEFSCDPKSIFYKVQSGLNFPDFKDKELDQGLEYVKSWIRKNFQLENKEDQSKFNRYWFVYKIHKSFLDGKELLSFTESLTDEFESLFQFCDLYLKNVGEKDFPAIPESFVKMAEQFSLALQKAKASKHYEKIRDFFACWLAAQQGGNLASLKRLYAMLLNPDIREKIIIKDEEIPKLLSESKESPGEIHVTPYVMNRVFLHAILEAPDQWTKEFYDAVKHVFKFVENKFNQAEVGLSEALLTSSYFNDLMNLIKYLLSLKEVTESKEEMARPVDMIVMPEFCKTSEELLRVHNFFIGPPARWKEYYDANKLKWNRIIENNFSFLMFLIIPPQDRFVFFSNFLSKNLNCFDGLAEKCKFLEAIPEEDQIKFINLFNWLDIRSGDDLVAVCRKFTGNLQRSQDGLECLLNKLGVMRVVSLISQNPSGIISYIKSISNVSRCYDILEKLGIPFVELYSIFSSPQCSLPDFHKERFLRLKKDDQIAFFRRRSDHYAIKQIFKDLASSQYPGYLELDVAISLFTPSSHFLSSLEQEIESYRGSLARALEPFHFFSVESAESIRAKSPRMLLDLVGSLSPKDRVEIIKHVPRRLLIAVASFEEIDSFLNLFDPSERAAMLDRIDPYEYKSFLGSSLGLSAGDFKREEKKSSADPLSKAFELCDQAKKNRKMYPAIFSYRLKDAVKCIEANRNSDKVESMKAELGKLIQEVERKSIKNEDYSAEEEKLNQLNKEIDENFEKNKTYINRLYSPILREFSNREKKRSFEDSEKLDLSSLDRGVLFKILILKFEMDKNNFEPVKMLVDFLQEGVALPLEDAKLMCDFVFLLQNHPDYSVMLSFRNFYSTRLEIFNDYSRIEGNAKKDSQLALEAKEKCLEMMKQDSFAVPSLSEQKEGDWSRLKKDYIEKLESRFGGLESKESKNEIDLPLYYLDLENLNPLMKEFLDFLFTHNMLNDQRSIYLKLFKEIASCKIALEKMEKSGVEKIPKMISMIKKEMITLEEHKPRQHSLDFRTLKFHSILARCGKQFEILNKHFVKQASEKKGLLR